MCRRCSSFQSIRIVVQFLRPCGYSEAVVSSKLWKSEASLSYTEFYMKSIGYMTPETSLSYQECDNMQKPIINSIFPKWEST
jgi:hypothetical protein